MTKRSDDYVHGPGGTHWFIDDESRLLRVLHNDVGWISDVFAGRLTTYETAYKELPRLLRAAYEAGLEDGKEQVRRALGV